MNFYYAYGLVLESDIALSAQISQRQKPDIQVKICNLNNKDKPAINNSQNNCILGKLPGVGKFLIKDGKEILIDPEPGITEKVLSPCILGSAMSVLLQQRGFLVLHASCVIIDRVAVAFLGNSGDGKSTICGAFHARGYEILTDDVMAISIEQDNIQVIPSIPEIKLRSDSANLMNYQEGSLSPLHPLTKKKIHKVETGFSSKSIPLNQIYVLAKGEQNQIEALSSQNGFIELIRHTRAIKTFKSQNFKQAHFHKCSTIAQKIPISRLIRKFSLAELPSLIESIEQHLTNNSIALVE